MEYLPWFLVPAFLVIVGTRWYYGASISPKELCIFAAISIGAAAIAAGVIIGSMYSGSIESNLIHGVVTSKEQEYTSCEHSYSCNCRSVCTGSGKSQSCSQVCDTCYEHSNDWDWRVDTTVGSLTIDRIDRRGSQEPPRFTQVVLGEPATLTDITRNYLKAMEDTTLLPPKVTVVSSDKEPKPYDYYRVNLVTNHTKVNVANWNGIIRTWLIENGAAKQVSIWVVLTDAKTSTYADSILYNIRGGAKNSIPLIYGVNAEGEVTWFKSHSFAMGMNNSVLHTKLSQAALGAKVSEDLLKSQLALIKKEYKRVSNSEFKELLEANLKASPIVIIIMLILQTVLLLFVGNYFHKENI